MKKKATILALAAAILIPATAKNVSETRAITAVEKLEASSAINIEYVQGTPVSLKISGDEAAVAVTKIKQSGNKLKIWRTDKMRKNQWPKQTVTVTLTTPAISDIELDGACSFKAKRLSSNGEIEIDLDGASKVGIGQIEAANVEIDCDGAASLSVTKASTRSIELDLDGASTATIAGITGHLDLECGGASKASLDKLKAVTGEVKLSGAASASTNIQSVGKQRASGAASFKNR